MNNVFNLEGCVAFITVEHERKFTIGAGQGIGREIAGVLAEAGADIAIAELDLASGGQAASDLQAMGRQAAAIQTGVRSSARVEAAAQQAIKKLGKIDILVANAGICVNTPAESTTDEDWLNVINVNLNGVFCHAWPSGGT
jgi:NAD(P)-dependent dehydrogenase (short-subunit alcohol dehydrogenase family)